MKERHVRWAAILLFAVLSSRLAAADEMGPTVRNPSLFTYQAPKNWTVGTAADGFPQAVGTSSNNFTPDITFKTNGYHSLADFVKSYQPTLVDTTHFPMKFVDQEPFVTTAGVKGARLRSIDPSTPPRAAQFSYVFLNQDGLVFEFACACAPADADRDAPIFDASMKTVVLLKLGE